MSHDHPDPPAQPGLLQQAAVVGFLVLIVALSARGHLVGDDRYSFSMFRSYETARFYYDWELADGTRQPWRPNTHLRGLGMLLGSGRTRAWVAGEGVIDRGVPQLIAWGWQHHRPEGAVALTAEVELTPPGGEMRLQRYAVSDETSP